ncbi:UvrD-helicase domain-containing protein [Mycobacterium servetii]|uniref:UvrD-helicase domain-containing protein n=1 Tax=Mycobacterium servetii TaxID=3237418 RepID=A0ABV4C8D0_9MYCO
MTRPAMWVALRLLREHPQVSAAVAARFTEILLDEAQDTSELQLACLEVLHTTGKLGSLVLVGDLEQSIYSFQGASAARCQKLADDRGLQVLTLTQNHRSSQRICDVAVNFCSRTRPDTAVGPHANCEITPEVALYPPNDPAASMEIYRGRLAKHGLAVEDATVLGRNWKVVDVLNGQTSLFKSSDRQYVIGQLAARIAAGTLTASHVRKAERLLAYCAWDTTAIAGIADNERSALRRAASDLLNRLPALEGDLRSWLIAARTVLHEVATTLTAELKHTGGRAITVNAGLADYQAAEVFTPAPGDLRARTVHSFKGEDSDAVMVVVRRPHASDPTSQMELWEAAVAGSEVDPEKEEERRVLFVALTRARRYCLVALPDDARGRAVAASCDGLGFQSVRG